MCTLGFGYDFSSLEWRAKRLCHIHLIASSFYFHQLTDERTVGRTKNPNGMESGSRMNISLEVEIVHRMFDFDIKNTPDVDCFERSTADKKQKQTNNNSDNNENGMRTITIEKYRRYILL